MEEISKLKHELERTRAELAVLYEVSNAMRTTLKLDEILYIILTGVTAHMGLGFNRALLFLVNEKEKFIEGKMVIGPESGEDANRIWKQIELEKKDLDDLIAASRLLNNVASSEFTKQIRQIKLPLNEQGETLLTLGVLEGMPLHLTRENMQNYSHDPVVKILNSEELVLVPLKAKDKVNGLILADNFITKKPISKDDMRMLIMLSNQAGLAIENSQLYEKTLISANSDSLTELWNHGYFQYLLHEELERARANKNHLSLIMLDIDDFKVYNDSLGHQVGDRILRDLSGLLKNHSRKMDFVCRYGGEEFISILPNTDKKEAFLIAERLREKVINYTFRHEEVLPNKQLTVSLGIATFPDDAAWASELIVSSDKALYQAKKQGKNKTCYL